MKNITISTFITLLVFAFPITVLSQRSEAEKPGRIAINTLHPPEIRDNDSLRAAFKADIRSGFPPLTVSFTDQSTGDIQSWNWLFGDTQNSDEQNPVHTYEDPGFYNVTLTVSDGSNYYTLEKEDFILVKESLGDCDTLDFPFMGTYTYYTIPAPNQGYVSGTNSFEDVAKANLFNPGYKSVITGVFVDFAIAVDVTGTDPDITVAVWNDQGSNGSPGIIIGSENVSLSVILGDVADDIATWVVFDDPVSVDEKFYVGIKVPLNGDTVAMWTDVHEDSPPGKGWEQWSDQSWHAYSSQQSWGLQIANAIHPVVCQVSSTRTGFPEGSIAIYPVPARNRIYIGLTDKSIDIKLIEIYDMQGNLHFSESFHSAGNVISVPVEAFAAGPYMVRAVSDKYIMNHKVLISR